jgi:ubiquitin-protein ligase
MEAQGAGVDLLRAEAAEAAAEAPEAPGPDADHLDVQQRVQFLRRRAAAPADHAAHTCAGGGLPAKVLAKLVEKELPAASAILDPDGIRVLVADLLGTDPTVYASFRGPPETPYEDGTFTVKLSYPLNYPFKPPKLRFTHPVFHPNISANGQSVDWLPLKDGWSPAMSVSSLLLGLRTYLGDTRCTLHSFPAPEGTPNPTFIQGGLNVAVGGGQQVYVVGHEAASAWLSNPQMAEQQAREHTSLCARARHQCRTMGGRLGRAQRLAFASGFHLRLGADSDVSEHCIADVLGKIGRQVRPAWWNQSLERQAEVWARFGEPDILTFLVPR